MQTVLQCRQLRIRIACITATQFQVDSAPVAQVLTIKRLARDWGLGGEYFTTKDLKVQLELDCSEATIAKALKQPGEVRARMGQCDTGA